MAFIDIDKLLNDISPDEPCGPDLEYDAEFIALMQDAEGKPTPGPNSGYKPIAWDILFWVPDVRGLHAELSGLGANLSGPPAETFYGTVEFQATDPDGHNLCFCEIASPAA